jgi:hypothetical protein
MKKLLFILAALLALPLAAEEATSPNPFDEPEGTPESGADRVSRIDLDPQHNVNDAVQQIIAGLPPEGRSSLVLDIPEEELAKMPMKGELRLRNTPLPIVLQYLGEKSPVGYRFRNNAWHIGKERADDLIAVSYRVSPVLLERIGIEMGTDQTFTTKKGRIWPSESEWNVTFTPLDPEAEKKQDAGESSGTGNMGVLRLFAARSFQEEFSAVLLLKERGYENLTLDR